MKSFWFWLIHPRILLINILNKQSHIRILKILALNYGDRFTKEFLNEYLLFKKDRSHSDMLNLLVKDELATEQTIKLSNGRRLETIRISHKGEMMLSERSFKRRSLIALYMAIFIPLLLFYYEHYQSKGQASTVKDTRSQVITNSNKTPEADSANSLSKKLMNDTISNKTLK